MSTLFRSNMSRRHLRQAVAAAALAALALSGCGGGGDDEADETHYSRDLSERCLRTVGRPGKPRDYISRSAKEGAVRVIVNDQEVVVSFAATVGEAEEIAEKYEQFGGKVVRKGTAVVRYSRPLSEDSERSVEGCLKAKPAAS